MTPKRPRRAVHGVLVADKPIGPSSTQFLNRLKHLFGAEKAGHGGTLDPLASGLLPVLFGEATKFAQEGLDADKAYEATVRLGQVSSTGDAEGEIVQERPVSVTTDQLQAALRAMLGPQDQVPPMHSALKVNGRALYDYAREGLTLERQPRRITLYALTLLDWNPTAQTARIQVACSKGTYIRSFAQDLGEALGCGAHLAALRRTDVASLNLCEAVSLEALEAAAASADPATAWAALDAFLAPVDHLVADWPWVCLPDRLADRLRHGMTIPATGLVLEPGQASPIPGKQATIMGAEGTRIRAFNARQQFLGVVVSHDGQLRPHRLVAESIHN